MGTNYTQIAARCAWIPSGVTELRGVRPLGPGRNTTEERAEGGRGFVKVTLPFQFNFPDTLAGTICLECQEKTPRHVRSGIGLLHETDLVRSHIPALE